MFQKRKIIQASDMSLRYLFQTLCTEAVRETVPRGVVGAECWWCWWSADGAGGVLMVLVECWWCWWSADGAGGVLMVEGVSCAAARTI